MQYPLAVGDRRPYPPTGLTTALWRRVPVEEVAWSDVITTQRHVSILAVLGVPVGGEGSADERPHVVEHEGKLYLEDGHNRMVRDLLAGRRSALVRVLRR